MAECKLRYKNTTVSSSQKVCEAIFDSVLCWPPTLAGSQIRQRCPDMLGFDTTKFAYKSCLENGVWDAQNQEGNVFSLADYTECISNTSELDYDVYDDAAMDQSKHIFVINKLGISLLVISLLSVLVTLIISKCILPMKVKHTIHAKIHVHLFASLLIMESLLLTLQVMNFIGMKTGWYLAAEVPFICEILIALNKYADITTIMWLTLESHFTYLLVTSGHLTVSGYMAYSITGWGLPSVPTTIWAVTLAVSHRTPCWSGHTFLPVGWLLEACKIALLILCACLFVISKWKARPLVRIRHELESKKLENDLSASSCHERRRVKYRLQMGILFFIFVTISQLTVLVTTHAPLPMSVAWQYVLTVITSSRGLFLSIIYCYFRIRLGRKTSIHRQRKK